MEFLQDISSSRPTFIYRDALDECQTRHCVKLLDSLNEVSQNSPDARIFLTGKLDIRDEIDKHLAGRPAARYIAPPRTISSYSSERNQMRIRFRMQSTRV